MNLIAIASEGFSAPSWLPACKKFINDVLTGMGISNWEVSVLLCGNERIRALNAQYRNQDRPTDVLSFQQEAFPRSEPPEAGKRIPVGDIVISLDMVDANAENYGVTKDEELKRLLIHGLLHLAGRDHATDGAEEPMLEEQEKILARLRGVKIIS